MRLLTPGPERLLFLYSALVVISVAVALAGLTWRLMGYAGNAEKGAVPVTVSAPAGTPNDGAVLPDAMLRLAPFGQGEPGTVPATRLPLTLRGVVQANPAEASSAWIASANGKVESIAVGGKVSGGSILSAVAGDHVLLETGGRLERLDFPRPARAPAAGAASAMPDATGEAGQSDE